MAGESILVVEDLAESLRFTASVLRHEGYRVAVASTGEQAWSTLKTLSPNLVLVDFMLPGMNGLELTERIKREARLRETLVVGLTACSMPEDEVRARKAGCDGYLTKPIGTGALLSRVRDYLDYGKDAPGAFDPVKPSPEKPGSEIKGLPDQELSDLRVNFLRAGKGVSRQLLAGLDGAQFDAGKASRTVHQWIGAAGLLGYASIAERARDAETALRTPPVAAARVRGPLTALARAFHNPSSGVSEKNSPSVMRALRGKRVGLIGLNGQAADLICGALEQVEAKTRLFEAGQSPYAEAVGICHLIMIHVRPDNMYCRWLAADAPNLPTLPTLFFGAAEHLLALKPAVHARSSGVLVEGCLPEEALMRLRLALTQPRLDAQRATGAGSGELVVAYGDQASQPQLLARLKENGLRCRLASNGPETILLLRDLRPPVAVVDVNLDGFEALAAIRGEDMPVRALFITAQSHEDEILRGFSLGAEDYLVPPFSGMELVARLKRLLG